MTQVATTTITSVPDSSMRSATSIVPSARPRAEQISVATAIPSQFIGSSTTIQSSSTDTSTIPVVYAEPVPQDWNIPVSRGIPEPRHSGMLGLGMMWNSQTSFASVTPAIPEVAEGGSSSLDREMALIGLYRMCRMIRVVAAIDCLFIIAFGIIAPIFFIIFPFPLAGFLGARWYSYHLTFIYSVYLGMEIVGCFVSIYFFPSIIFIVLRLAYLLLNIMIMRLTVRTAGYFRIMDPEDFVFLRTSPVILEYGIGRTCFCI